MRFALSKPADNLVVTIDSKPGIFASGGLPTSADNANDVVLLGFGQYVPPEVPDHDQGSLVEAKTLLSDSPILRSLESSEKLQLVGWPDELQFRTHEVMRKNDESDQRGDQCNNGNLPTQPSL